MEENLSATMPLLLQASAVNKSYGALAVLRDIDLTLHAGEVVALQGSSGAGKTTLLQVIGTLDRPDSGEIRFEGQELRKLGEKKLSTFRNQNLGFVFQFHHLMAEFTALENVTMPALIQGRRPKEAQVRATELLHYLGLGHRLTHQPGELSGGEQQRVAVARALMNSPKLILADEPTGNLDNTNGEALFTLFLELARDQGISFLIATHNEHFAASAHRSLYIEEGRLREAVPA